MKFLSHRQAPNSLNIDSLLFKSTERLVEQFVYLSSDQYLARYRQGGYVKEIDNDRGFQVFESSYREIIQITDFNISFLMDTLSKENLSFSVDRDFCRIVMTCSSSDASEELSIVRAGTQAILSELHDIDIAHSIGIYQADRLVGGLVGFEEGKAFFIVDSFGKKAAALAALQIILNESEFLYVDCVAPNPLTRRVGSGLLTSQAYALLRDQAFDGTADFSEFKRNNTDQIYPFSELRREECVLDTEMARRRDRRFIAQNSQWRFIR